MYRWHLLGRLRHPDCATWFAGTRVYAKKWLKVMVGGGLWFADAADDLWGLVLLLIAGVVVGSVAVVVMTPLQAAVRLAAGGIRRERAVPSKRGEIMRYLVLLTAVSIGLCAAAPGAQTGAKKKSRAPAETTLTGCVDQAEDGSFILTGNQELHKIATLHGDGFPDDGFAKHLGHHVKVTGRMAKDGGEAVLRVKEIETVSETCSASQ
jgi:hypothetical protein